MIERLQARRTSEEGFTLVELLVVIVILGILASIVVFAVGGITDKGDQKAKDTDTAVLQAAEEAQFAQATSGAVYVSESALVTGKFIKALSSKNDICLVNQNPAAVDSTHPLITAANSDYKVMPHTTDSAGATNSCASLGTGPTGYTLAP